MDRTHREAPVRKARQGQETEVDSARLPGQTAPDRNVRQEVHRQMEKTEGRRKAVRQEIAVRKMGREVDSVRIVRQAEETGSVRLLVRTMDREREETVVRKKEQEAGSVRIPEEMTEMTEIINFNYIHSGIFI